jgi:hypothetical protein
LQERAILCFYLNLSHCIVVISHPPNPLTTTSSLRISCRVSCFCTPLDNLILLRARERCAFASIPPTPDDHYTATQLILLTPKHHHPPSTSLKKPLMCLDRRTFLTLKVSQWPTAAHKKSKKT